MPACGSFARTRLDNHPPRPTMTKRLLALPLLLLCGATPALGIDCSMIGGNLLPNCGFESGTSGWAATGLQAVGGGETGSAGYFNDTQAGLGDLLSPCVAVAPSTALLVGLVSRGHGPASTPDT